MDEGRNEVWRHLPVKRGLAVPTGRGYWHCLNAIGLAATGAPLKAPRRRTASVVHSPCRARVLPNVRGRGLHGPNDLRRTASPHGSDRNGDATNRRRVSLIHGHH
jgi:hypothetical protein